MKFTGKVCFCAFLLCIAGYAAYAASGWSFKAGFFPLAVSIPLLVLAALQLYFELWGAPEAGKGPAVEADFTSSVPPEMAQRRVLAIFSWIAGFIVFVYLIGFPLTVPLFMIFFLKFQSDAGWFHSIALTAVTWACFYALFQRLVHLQFEPGAIQLWLGL
jgi:hypothetical protein